MGAPGWKPKTRPGLVKNDDRGGFTRKPTISVAFAWTNTACVSWSYYRRTELPRIYAINGGPPRTPPCSCSRKPSWSPCSCRRPRPADGIGWRGCGSQETGIEPRRPIPTLTKRSCSDEAIWFGSFSSEFCITPLGCSGPRMWNPRKVQKTTS